MNCLQMIDEWRKGCTCATPGKPEECEECTRALIDAMERRLKTPPPVQLTDDLIKRLRDFDKAYPVDMFPELTMQDRSEYPALVSRASASMGRHLAKFMVEAADEIERLLAENEELKAEINRLCPSSWDENARAWAEELRRK